MNPIKQKAFTVEELLKIIPVEESLRQDILTNYSSWTLDQKAITNEMLWDEFSKFFDVVKKTAYDVLFQTKFGDNKYEGNINLWSEADKLAWKYVSELNAGKKEDDLLVEKLRQELKSAGS